MKLPNCDQAVVDMAKLVDYCLDPTHWRGRHKARVFQSVLGIGSNEADQLRDALLFAAENLDATPDFADEFGQRFVIDFPMTGPTGRGIVRSAWIVRSNEDFPRFSARNEMKRAIHEFDVVALTEDLPERQLARGQVGTVVDVHSPTDFEVEFSDDEGQTYAVLALRADQLMVLHHRPLELA